MMRDDRSRACDWAAVAILVLAAATRLYQLDLPSLWWDEILVPLNARFDILSILIRCATQDFHPPGYYLFTKAVLAVGSGNAALRLPSVLAGLAAVWLLYRLGRRHVGAGAALIASSLLSCDLLFTLVSRQVRPYTMVTCLSVLALHFVLRYLEDRSRRWLAWCLAVAAAAAFLHYTALLLAGSLWVVVAVDSAARRDLRTPVLFGLGLLGIVALDLPFLLPSLLREPKVVEGAGRLDLLLLMGERIGQMFHMDEPHWPRWAMACASVLGLAALLAERRRTGLAFLGLILAPLAALLAVAYGTYFNPWHLLFMAPPLFLAAGYALALPLRRPWAQAVLALALAGACTWYYFTDKAPRFYAEESNTGTYQGTARAILGRVAPGALFMPPDEEFLATVNWYLDRFSSPNPMRAQILGPGDAEARLEYVTDGRYWIFAENEKKVLAAMPAPALDESWADPSPARTGPGSGRLEKIRRLEYRIPRSPVSRVAALPYEDQADFHPVRFYSRVNALRDVCVYPMNGFALAATTPGRPGTADFVYQLADGLKADSLDLSLHYANPRRGHVLRALVSLDGGEFVERFRSTGKDAGSTGRISLTGLPPFDKLTLRFELTLAPDTPSYHGEYIQHLLLKDFSLRLGRGS